LYLNEKIDDETFKKVIIKDNIHKTDDLEIIIEQLSSSRASNSFVSIFIKDEIIQIASVLKNSNSQLFGSIPVNKYGMFQSGKNSLLGIGNHVVGFLSIYLHIRNCFSKYNFENIFEVVYAKEKGPKFLLKNDDVSYYEWFNEFINVDNLDSYINKESNNSTYHIVCFSNRQGFRVTKHSVSAAMQSLYLSFLPSFTLNTLTHELLHAHVHAEIMSEMFPVEESNHHNLNEDVYEKYTKLHIGSNQTYSLKEYIQISFLLMASKLIKSDDFNSNYHFINKVYSQEHLSKKLRHLHKEIEEVIVHILDLLYFYNSDANMYIKAIWISWLSLPYSFTNLKQYILRSICAITSVHESSDKLDRFDNAISILEKELISIKEIDFINKNYIDFVLSNLKDQSFKDNLRYDYTNAYVYLVDITKKFFFSSSLKSLLNYDEELTESEGGFTYDLSIGEFENRTINSPIALINEINKYNISNISTLNNLDKVDIERKTSWLNSLIVTSIKKYKDDE